MKDDWKTCYRCTMQKPPSSFIVPDDFECIGCRSEKKEDNAAGFSTIATRVIFREPLESMAKRLRKGRQ